MAARAPFQRPLANDLPATRVAPCSDLAMRAACDRCRAQKLRCVTEARNSRICVRCKAAGVDCHHSRQSRPGRPSARQSTGPRGPAAVEGTRSSPVLTSTPDHLLQATSTSTTTASYPSQENHDAGDDSLHTQSAAEALRPQVQSGSDNDNFFSSALAHPDHYDEYLDGFLSLSDMSTVPNFEHTSTLDAEAHQPVSQQPYDNGYSTSFSCRPVEIQPEATAHQTCGLSDVGQVDGVNATSKHSLHGGFHSGVQDEQWHALKLCQLTSQLFTDTGRNGDDPQSNIPDRASSVLSSTNLFIDTLSSFYTPTAPECRSGTFDTNSVRHMHQHSCVDLYPSPACTAQRLLNANVSKHSTGTSIPPTLNTPTILQLLSCYIRLLSLHAKLYGTVRMYLTKTMGPLNSASQTTLPPLFPSLAIGSVSLAGYAGFQYRLLLQVCLHTLGRAEALMGLPDQFRLRGRHETINEVEFGGCSGACGVQAHGLAPDFRVREACGRGILETSATHRRAGVDQLVQAAMRQANDGDEGGDALIREIATLVVDLRGLLQTGTEI